MQNISLIQPKPPQSPRFGMLHFWMNSDRPQATETLKQVFTAWAHKPLDRPEIDTWLPSGAVPQPENATFQQALSDWCGKFDESRVDNAGLEEAVKFHPPDDDEPEKHTKITVDETQLSADTLFRVIGLLITSTMTVTGKELEYEVTPPKDDARASNYKKKMQDLIRHIDSTFQLFFAPWIQAMGGTKPPQLDLSHALKPETLTGQAP